MREKLGQLLALRTDNVPAPGPVERNGEKRPTVCRENVVDVPCALPATPHFDEDFHAVVVEGRPYRRAKVRGVGVHLRKPLRRVGRGKDAVQCLGVGFRQQRRHWK